MHKLSTQLALHTLALGAALFSSTSSFAQDRDYLDWSGVRPAWNSTQGAGIAIATLNTGVNYELPEFAGRVAREADGSYGFDAVSGCHDPMDKLDLGLGTQVASVEAGNGFGVAPAAKLIPVRIFDEYGGGANEYVIRGLDYAVSRHARVIEVGGGPFNFDNGTSTALCQAFQRADASGALLVLPPGNEGESLNAYPSGCPLKNVVNVAALTASGDLAPYSNFGFPAVHLAAPAENIWRISRDGSVRKDGQGTSFSSAFVAGVAALVWSKHPHYRAADVKSALIRGSTARDSLRGKVLANGYVNAMQALRVPITPAP
jgi:subtilisin family serine protease